MKIRYKLFAGLLGIPLIFAAVATFLIVTNRQVQYDARELAAYQTKLKIGSSRLFVALITVQKSAEELLTEKQRAELEPTEKEAAAIAAREEEAAIRENQATIDQVINFLTEVTHLSLREAHKRGTVEAGEETDELESIETIREEAQEYKQRMNKYLAVMETQPDEADEILNTEVEPHYEQKLLPLVQKYAVERDEEDGRKASQIEQSVASVSRLVAISAVGVTFLAVLIAIYLSRSFAQPLVRLTTAVTGIGQGHLKSRIEVKSRDEIGMLGQAFNQMADDLSHTTVSKSYVDNIITSMADMLFVTDAMLCIQRVNPVALTLLGYREEELLGQPLSAALEGELVAKSPATLTPDSLIRDAEAFGVTRDGRRIPVSFSASSLRNGAAQDGGLVCVAQDVTEQRRIETELRQRDLELIEAQHIALLGNWEWDVATNRTKWSAALYHIYGVQPEDFPPTLEGYLSLVHPDDRERVADLARTTLQSGQGCSYGHRIIWPDQSVRFIHVNLRVAHDEAGQPTKMFGTAQDVTDRVHMEEELKEARDAALESARLKSEFLANMSHEIRTPMNGIMGMTELTLDTDLTSQQREYLDIVRSSTVSLLTIINDILDFSKIEAGKLELDSLVFNLPETIADTTRTLALRAHEKGLELACQVSADVPEMVNGDAGRLRQVLLNLIGNAVKFTERGEVILRIERESGTDNHVLLHFSISDTGIGIPAGKEKLIFHAFAQADGSTTRRYGGTGLGLPICSQLIELMGGRIWVESEAGKGSTFHFTARFTFQSESNSKPPASEPADLYGLLVLVVDDNATNRRILKESLKRWQMKPVLVEDGPSALVALRQARKDGRPFSLVLLDACMPKMDGFAVAQQIRNLKEAQGATIMMLTSIEQNLSTKRLRELGVAHYLVKPISRSDLFNAIQRALQPSTIPVEIQTPKPSAVTTSRPALRFLVAEDNEVNQKVVTRLLEKQGHSVVLASNGQRAIGAMKGEEFDVVLMDVQMPVMNGLEATRVIRRNEQQTGGHVPVVAMTALAMTGDREQCLAAGMDAYLSKPVQFEELLKTIDMVTTRVGEPRGTEVDARALVSHPARILDRAAVLTRFEGDEELLREVIDIFQKEVPAQLAVMRGAIDRQEAETLDFTVHRLRGSIGVFGEGTAFHSAGLLEQVARVGDLSNARKLLAALERDLGHFSEELQQLELEGSIA